VNGLQIFFILLVYCKFSSEIRGHLAAVWQKENWKPKTFFSDSSNEGYTETAFGKQM